MDYKASIDALCKVMTAGVFVLFIAIGQKNIRAILAANGDTTTVLIHGSSFLLLVAIILGSYLFSTQSYTVTGSELIIRRPIKDKVVNIADITEISAIDTADFSGTIRTFGNGGLFGYYGKYHNSKIGNMTWYVTQRENRILVRTQQGEKLILSPDDLSLVDKVQGLRQNKQ